jgi:signal transduction histidine kinase
VGRDSFDLIHPEDQSQSRRALDAVLETPSRPNSASVKVRLLRKDGAWCWVENTMFNCLDEPGIEAIVVSCHAIHERDAAREQDRSQAGELIRSNARLEDFAYAVAHDLREPLRTISMFTELLVEEGQSERVITKVSQETLADMIGTTRSRVSFFMNKFRRLGFIEYNGSIEVHSSLLNVVLHD